VSSIVRVSLSVDDADELIEDEEATEEKEATGEVVNVELLLDIVEEDEDEEIDVVEVDV